MSPKPASIEEKEQDARDSVSTSSVAPPPELTEEQEAKLWSKIDRRLMPILCLMYLMSFLDRGNIGVFAGYESLEILTIFNLQAIGNARLQGLVTELGLGNQYNIALTMYFIVSTNSTRPGTPVLK
ncbi:hypothetical protein PQX77_013935 [Marasmius sp. AFHP31]|nr:hypothetical protein PQX77_013935 [Marasmius sp. AFHP31]